jgi:hypothetical protein
MGRVYTPRPHIVDAAWAVALRSTEFGYAEISAEAGISMNAAESVIRRWVETGAARVVRERAGKSRKLFALTPGTRAPDRPRGRTPEANMWEAMRRLGSFSPSSLALTATTEAIEVTTAEAATYCRALLASGHLSVARKAAPPRHEAIYRLDRRTGPEAPRLRRVQAVVDPNTAETLVIRGDQA